MMKSLYVLFLLTMSTQSFALQKYSKIKCDVESDYEKYGDIDNDFIDGVIELDVSLKPGSQYFDYKIKAEKITYSYKKPNSNKPVVEMLYEQHKNKKEIWGHEVPLKCKMYNKGFIAIRVDAITLDFDTSYRGCKDTKNSDHVSFDFEIRGGSMFTDIADEAGSAWITTRDDSSYHEKFRRRLTFSECKFIK